MTIPLTLREFNELAEPILNEVFFAGYDRALGQGMSVLPLYGQRNPGNKGTAYAQSMGGVGTYGIREEGGPVKKDYMEQLFKTTFTMVEYNKVVPLDKILIEDQQYFQISDIVDSLGLMAAKTRRKDGASVFNRAFNSSYLGADGVVLCSAAHPLDKEGDNTQANAGALTLTYANVVSTAQAMQLFKDARNEPAVVIPDTLVVPVALSEAAGQVGKAMLKPGSADNDLNLMNGLNIIVDPYMDASDVNNWFLVDSLLASRQLLWWDREMPNFGIDMPTQTDKNYYVGGTMRYDFGWMDWRWVYGHAVA